LQVHIVKKGDTLWKISREYGVSFDEVKRLNAHLANPDYIVPGMKIFIPDMKTHETSMGHPYSDGRPVKKDMGAAPHYGSLPPKAKQYTAPATTPSKEQPIKAQPMKEQPKAQPIQPVPIPMPTPMPAPQPIHIHHQPIYQAPPVQPIQPYIIPFHMMHKPEVEKMPSPKGWKLDESTGIDIHVNFEENYTCNVQPPKEEVKEKMVAPMLDEPSSAIYHKHYESCEQPMFTGPMYYAPHGFCGHCGHQQYPMYGEPVYNHSYMQPMPQYHAQQGCGCHHTSHYPVHPYNPFPY